MTVRARIWRASCGVVTHEQCTVILEPSGFPLGLIPVALLIWAHQMNLRSRPSPAPAAPRG